MPFTLDEVVPWGRSMDEYVAMFALSRRDLGSSILGCADGPASFNAEMWRRGTRVISIDPLYAFSPGEIRGRIDDTYPTVLAQLERNREAFVWTRFQGPGELARHRMQAMDCFLADYPTGRKAGRYLVGALPRLPCADNGFDLALCSHLLFLYSDHLSAEFHCQAIRELLRVAQQVRIFPLLDLAGKTSVHLPGVCQWLAESGRGCQLRRVEYELQRGGNRMLCVR